MNSAEDRNRASALTKLLRAELRDARFSVTHLALTNTEFRPNEFGGGTSSDLDRSSSGIGSRELPPRSDTDPTLTADDLKEAFRLQPQLRNMPRSVHTVFEYWLKSKPRRIDLADRLVFTRTALEALFLDDGNRAELTFRLATNGAWYTGRNPTERRQRFDTLKNVYAAASGAVHSGRVKKPAETLLTDGQDICRLAILKRLRSGQDPVWEDIVFGR